MYDYKYKLIKVFYLIIFSQKNHARSLSLPVNNNQLEITVTPDEINSIAMPPGWQQAKTADDQLYFMKSVHQI